MQVLIDGNPVECNEIELVNDDLIIGCSGAGGSHHEINGSSRISLTAEGLTAEIYNSQGEIESLCSLPLDELLVDMDKMTIRMKNYLDNFDEYVTIKEIFE
jgi:hypothetical protein